LVPEASSVALRGVYCTIVARNYLPQALSLYASIREHEKDRDLYILIVDGARPDLEQNRPRLKMVTTEFLGLDTRELDNLAMIYDIVEFSTSVKPLLLTRLLEQYEQAVYLDPDTFVVSPLSELEALVDEHGVVLTPHFQEPIKPGESHISEVHSLTVGVHNLGFCAVGRQGLPFLRWWWSHLERECLIYPLLGLFVDQKWTDIGSMLFSAHSLKHYGYNVGPWNLHERQFVREGQRWKMLQPDQDLRLYHFSGFNPLAPDEISVRFNMDLRGSGLASQALMELSDRYSTIVLEARDILGEPPAYLFDRDSAGKKLSTQLRRVYRQQLVSQGNSGLPSAFASAERRQFAAWRWGTLAARVRLSAGDSSIAAKYAFPDTFHRFRRSLPALFRGARAALLRGTKVRR
jgi:hypothetical protein